MESGLLISICIANYNGSKIIEACIDAVINQKTTTDIEIIIHDDASTDNSAEIIQGYGEKITAIYSDVNLGFCISNNRMADIAAGDYILFLNNDTELFPDAIEMLWQYTKSHHHSGILSLPQYSIDSKTLIDRGMKLDLFCNPAAITENDQEKVSMVMGSCLWIPKKLWQKTGGFPDWFETLAEDMYMCLYSRLLGENVVVVQNSGYYHWVGHSLGGGKIQSNGRLCTTFIRKAKSERNKTFVMVLFYPWFVLILILPLHIIISVIEGILLSLIKFDMRILKKIYFYLVKELIKNSFFLLKERRKVQSKKVIKGLDFFRGFKLVPYKIKMLIKHGVPDVK